MAKARKAWTVQDRGDTGIYKNLTYQPTSTAGVAQIREFNEKVGTANLPKMQLALWKFVNEKLGPDTWRIEIVEDAKGVRIDKITDPNSESRLPRQIQEATIEAMESLALIALIKRTLKVGNYSKAVSYGVNLGVYWHKICIRIEAEEDAKRGRTTLAASGNGGRARKLLKDDDAEVARQERERLISLGHTKKDACTIVGDAYNVSYKTIGRL